MVKRRKASKEERLARIVEGKSSFEFGGHRGGLTNLEKKRKKSFLMVRRLALLTQTAVSVRL
jgi:hypothetical protein